MPLQLRASEKQILNATLRRMWQLRAEAGLASAEDSEEEKKEGEQEEEEEQEEQEEGGSEEEELDAAIEAALLSRLPASKRSRTG